MKKSELKQIIKEELLKEQGNWITPLKISWRPGAAGLYEVIVLTENGRKIASSRLLSDSMPNDMKKLNQLLLKVIDQIDKMGEKH